MIDYGQDEKYHYSIETKLDQPIELLGINVAYIANIAFIGLFSLAVLRSLFAAVMLISLATYWYRKSGKAELECRPLTFNRWIINFVKRLPDFLRTGLFPSLYGTDSYDDFYRQ